MSAQRERIPSRFRLALAGKGALLLALAAAIVALAAAAMGKVDASPVVRVGLVLFGFTAPFLGWAALLAFADAALGQAVRVSGAVALASRRAGYSLKLPTRGYAEFILFNPWGALVPGKTYRVLIGRFSRVVVAPPEPT